MLVPVRQGRCIEDMDVFGTALILYERCNGWPAIALLPLQEGGFTLSDYILQPPFC